MPKEETFPNTLKYIDVTRSTYTDLDVMQEKRVDDYWNVDMSRTFIRFLERIHEVHSIESKTSPGISVGRGETHINSSNYQT